MIANIQDVNTRLPFSVMTETGEIYTTGQLIHDDADVCLYKYIVFLVYIGN